MTHSSDLLNTLEQRFLRAREKHPKGELILVGLVGLYHFWAGYLIETSVPRGLEALTTASAIQSYVAGFSWTVWLAGIAWTSLPVIARAYAPPWSRLTGLMVICAAFCSSSFVLALTFAAAGS